MTTIDVSRATALRENVPAALRRVGSSIREETTRMYVPLRYGWLGRFRSTASLPKVITVAGADVGYRLTLSNEQFPTQDDQLPESGPYDEPVVGSIGGPWDRFKQPWTETVFFRSFVEHYCEGREWPETDYYDWYVEFSTKDQTPAERFRDIDRLFESMNERGYVPQAELAAGEPNEMERPRMTTRTILGETFPDEPVVGIGRRGEIIRLNGGHHRLSFARLLGLEEVPVIVTIRHERWATVRDAFERANSLSELPDSYRQHAGHPDLPRVPDRANPKPEVGRSA